MLVNSLSSQKRRSTIHINKYNEIRNNKNKNSGKEKLALKSPINGIPTRNRLRSDGDGLTTSAVFPIAKSFW
jgi:hypothetical protein